MGLLNVAVLYIGCSWNSIRRYCTKRAKPTRTSNATNQAKHVFKTSKTGP